ncbi:MAG: FHA domain-containing protein, partial [Myxococcota bacterium]
MSGKLILSFEIYNGSEHLFRKEISAESVTIGRGPAAMLRVEDNALADLHAVINLNDDGSVLLLDLGGPSGTKVNGEAVNNTALRTGDQIEIGPIRIVVSIVDEQAFADEEATQLAVPPMPLPTARKAPAPISASGPAPTSRAPETVMDEPAASSDESIRMSTEDVMAFIMRSGTAQGDAGINRKSGKVLEVAEIWGDVVMDVKHFPKGGQPVTIGTSTGYR